MNFNSLHFLIFFSVVLFVYWVLPAKVRWAWLLLASYYFYMSWNPWLVILLLWTTGISYGSAIAIEHTSSVKIRKLWLALTIFICLGILVFFKYFNFLFKSITDFLSLFSINTTETSLKIILPVGISFYTFQTLSYVIDVYCGDFKAERHLGYYALFVVYFPQLVAGPIEKPSDLIPQLRTTHYLSTSDLASGFRIMLGGFFRKCVVADFCGIYVDNVFSELESANSFAMLIAGALFCVQMYCDFAGYSEIATGAARMMGVRLTKNFDRPYLSQSYTEFFRRWHISLNRWFTQYLYIPLGGSKKGKVRKIFNIFIVFSLCGLWHGANWTYVLWGLYAAFFVSIESVFLPMYEKLCNKKNILRNSTIKLLRRIIMFIIFIPAALLFRSQSVSEALLALSRLFTQVGSLSQTFDTLGMNGQALIQLMLSFVCMWLIYYFENYGESFSLSNNKHSLPLENSGLGVSLAKIDVGRKFMGYLCVFILVAFCWIAYLANYDASSFAYFQF